jgi:flagellar motor switch protein FliN/FliY
MDHRDKIADIFLEAWAPEFEKSIQMFTGRPAKIELDAKNRDVDAAAKSSLIWQGHTFERGGSTLIWTGIPAEACAKLTEGLAEDTAGCESLYREILTQSFESAAHIITGANPLRITCGPSPDNNPAPDLTSEETTWETAWLAADGADPVPIFVVLDPATATILLVPNEDAPPTPQPDRTPQGMSDGSARISDRLADLELPVAVVLGRTRLPIRDVLKLGAGSLVELNRDVGQQVDIVVHNAVVARGDVVSVNGNYGIRIREVISRTDRLALRANAQQAL